MGVKFNPFTSKLDIVDSPSGEFSDIELALGTQSAPSLSFTGDPNTGIYSPGADQVALTTAGSERLRITADGKLGVGTSSPSTNLEISSSSSKVRITDNDTASSGNCSLEWAFSGGRNGYIGYGGSNDLYIWQELNNRIIFGTNATNALTIDASQRVGIGTTSPGAKLDISGQTYIDSGYIRFLDNATSPPGTAMWRPASDTLAFNTQSQERARIDSSGRLLVGTSSGTNLVQIDTGTLGTTGSGTSGALYHITRRNGTALSLALENRGAADAATPNNAGTQIGFYGYTGSAQSLMGIIACQADGQAVAAGDGPGRLVFSTTADGAASPTERMRINQQGSVRIGGTGDPGAIHIIDKPGVAIGTQVLTIQGSDESVRVYNASSFANPNGAAMVMWVRANNTTSRSINAAGTINASGTDYAEYMTKAGNFVLAKGDVCGIDANGLLTNIYTNSVSFVVKSTNPSYVGGDTWGCGFDADSLELEAERQKVDRIAFAGQVPVNVTSAAPGQYIVPFVTEDGGITGIAKDEADLTLAEYMRAVGKVIAIEDDGRARIIVKVA